MLLTPTDIRSKRFLTYGGIIHPRAYDADEVDSFLEQVESTMTVLSKLAYINFSKGQQ